MDTRFQYEGVEVLDDQTAWNSDMVQGGKGYCPPSTEHVPTALAGVIVVSLVPEEDIIMYEALRSYHV